MDATDVALQEHLAFASTLSLRECCAVVAQSLSLPAFTFDLENDTEWGCVTVGHLEYNISRPYEPGTLEAWDPSVPSGCTFGFTLQLSSSHPLANQPDRVAPELVRPLAQALAAILQVPVHYHRTWHGPGSNVERAESYVPDPTSP